MDLLNFDDLDNPKFVRSLFETMMLKLGQIITEKDMNLTDITPGRISTLMRRYENELGCSFVAKDIRLSFKDPVGEFSGGGILIQWSRIDPTERTDTNPVRISFSKID